MEEELIQAIKELIREEMKEINDRLANIEAIVQKTDTTIDNTLSAIKSKPSLAALLKLLQQKKSNDKE